MRHPNRLGSLRKQWKLSHEELADLLGYRFKSAVSRIEADERLPTLQFALACEVVFGECPRKVFPGLYRAVEEAVMRHAAKLDETLRHDFSHDANVKRELLREMTRRAGKRTRA